MSGLHSSEILICLGLGIFKNLPNDSNVQLKLRWADLMTRGPELNLKHDRASRTLYLVSEKTHSHVSRYETGSPWVLVQVLTSLSVTKDSCKGQLGISVLMVGTKVPSSSPGLQIMKVWAPVWGSARHTSFSTPLLISCCVSTAPSTFCCVDQRLTHAWWYKLTYECRKNSCCSCAKCLLSGGHIKIIWPDKDYSKEKVSGKQCVQQKEQGVWCQGAWHGALALPLLVGQYSSHHFISLSFGFASWR